MPLSTDQACLIRQGERAVQIETIETNHINIHQVGRQNIHACLVCHLRLLPHILRLGPRISYRSAASTDIRLRNCTQIQGLFCPASYNTIQYKYRCQRVETGSNVRPRPGPSNRNLCEQLLAPQMFHLVVSSHFVIMGIEGGVLCTLSGAKCNARTRKHQPRQDKVGKRHSVGDQVSRRTRRKVRLDMREGARQTLCVLVKGLTHTDHSVKSPSRVSVSIPTSRLNWPYHPKIVPR